MSLGWGLLHVLLLILFLCDEDPYLLLIQNENGFMSSNACAFIKKMSAILLVFNKSTAYIDSKFLWP